MNFLKLNKVNLLPWFDKGADVSPIEPIWALMKEYLEKNSADIKC